MGKSSPTSGSGRRNRHVAHRTHCPSPSPPGVDVAIDGRDVTVKGPKGTLRTPSSSRSTVEQADDGTLAVTRPDDERASRSLHGLSRTLVANMVTGVTDGYTKTLEIVGVGYRVQPKGEGLEFALGFSHPVLVDAPEGITFAVESPDPVLGHRASTSSRSARSPPTSASCASPTRTRARASGTRARSSAARSERLVSSHGSRCRSSSGSKTDPRRSSGAAPSPAGPQEGRGYGRASAPGRDPLDAARVRPGRRRHVGRTLASASTMEADLRGGQRRQDRQGAQGRRARGRAGQGRRRRAGRLRPWWQPLPRSGRGHRRRRPRRRAGAVTGDTSTDRHDQQD